MKPKKAIWIHLAGNPPNITRQEPPYWRIRIGDSGKEYPVDAWRLSGVAESGNLGEGTELNASFLLWWALYGELTLQKENNRRIAHIKLQPRDSISGTDKGSTLTIKPLGSIRIYGAPDLVSQGKDILWRCVVGGEEFTLTSFGLEGDLTHQNTKPGEDIQNEDPLRRLWLEFEGKVRIDHRGHAKILLG